MEAEPSDDNFQSPEEFQRKARKWAKLFKEVHFEEDITPYIHGKLLTLNRKIMNISTYKN